MSFWNLAGPELTVAVTALVLFILESFMLKSRSGRPFTWLALLGIAVSFALELSVIGSPVSAILAGTYRIDSFSIAVKLLLLFGTGLVLLMSIGPRSRNGQPHYLMFTALLGAMMLASSADMITLFIALELMAVSSYMMIAMNKATRLSGGAAFRSFANGGIATAIMLFGMSYVYGFTGTTNLYGMSLVLNTANHNSLLFSHRFLLVFIFMIVFFGLAYKISSMWLPSVFEGASASVAAFLSVIPKIAGFILLYRFFLIAFMNAPGIHVSPTSGPVPIFVTVQPYLAIFAALAMIIGNLAALRQKNMKRLFACASMAQAGYLLIPFVSLTPATFPDTWFYFMATLFVNIGAFAVIQTVIHEDGDASQSHFVGLFQRSRIGAVAMAIYLISLAGVPITAGFIGKYHLFLETWRAGHQWLAFVLVAAVLISWVFCFKWTIQLFLRAKSPHVEKLSLPVGTCIVLCVCAIGTLLFGIFPQAASEFLQSSFHLNDFFKANF